MPKPCHLCYQLYAGSTTASHSLLDGQEGCIAEACQQLPLHYMQIIASSVHGTPTASHNTAIACLQGQATKAPLIDGQFRAAPARRSSRSQKAGREGTAIGSLGLQPRSTPTKRRTQPDELGNMVVSCLACHPVFRLKCSAVVPCSSHGIFEHAYTALPIIACRPASRKQPDLSSPPLCQLVWTNPADYADRRTVAPSMMHLAIPPRGLTLQM